MHQVLLVLLALPGVDVLRQLVLKYAGAGVEAALHLLEVWASWGLLRPCCTSRRPQGCGTAAAGAGGSGVSPGGRVGAPRGRRTLGGSGNAGELAPSVAEELCLHF